jgi:hypothetical protein
MLGWAVTAPAKAQALPRAIEECRANTRNASLTTQKKSRSFSCFFSFSVWVSITIALTSHATRQVVANSH